MYLTANFSHQRAKHKKHAMHVTGQETLWHPRSSMIISSHGKLLHGLAWVSWVSILSINSRNLSAFCGWWDSVHGTFIW